MEKNIIIWGAGKIGRGFIAELLKDESYHITFIDQSEHLISELNKRKSYQIINALTNTDIRKVQITDYSSLITGDKLRIQEVINVCDYIIVSIYPMFFKNVALSLSEHILKRKEKLGTRPIDIILCTNFIPAGSEFKKYLYQELNTEEIEYFNKNVGVVETIVIRNCAEPAGEIKEKDPLAVLTNGFSHLLVDYRGFKGKIPQIKAFKYVSDVQAEEKRKLFTYNMFHALLAYFGVRKGYKLIPECFADEEIEKIALGALAESSDALQKEFHFSSSEMQTWKANIIQQTNNSIVGDTVFRYAADPIRKLSKEDRLLGPALLCIKNGIYPKNIILGIAAGLLFSDKEDPQSLIMQEIISTKGIETAIREICELPLENKVLVKAILNEYSNFIK